MTACSPSQRSSRSSKVATEEIRSHGVRIGRVCGVLRRRQPKECPMKLARLAVLAAAGVAIAAFAGVFQPSGANSAATDTSSGGITVLGTGSTTVVPDRASFAFGTVTQAATANAALAASSQSVARVIAALKKAGVAQADIQTSDVSLSPRMNDKGDGIVGYTASNTVTATIRKIGDAGDVVDAAVGAGSDPG